MKKVYYIPVNQNNDYLLFDFNISVNDTAWCYETYDGQNVCSISPQCASGYYTKVMSIDSVLIENSYRKKYYFQMFHIMHG